MPPPGYEPFLHAICANHDDDTARLVYADWLDENGDPDRAEFIRLGVMRALQQPDEMGLGQRSNDLFRANEQAWREELPKHQMIEWGETYRRGFVFSIKVRAPYVLAQNSSAIFSAAPLTRLSLRGISVANELAALSLPEIQRIQWLSLSVDTEANAFWRELTRCPYLTSLQELSVEPYRRGRWGSIRLPVLTATDAQPLVESPVLSRLRLINLRGPVRNAVADLLRTRFTVVIS